MALLAISNLPSPPEPGLGRRAGARRLRRTGRAGAGAGKPLTGLFRPLCRIVLDRQSSQSPPPEKRPPARRSRSARVMQALGDLVEALLDLRAGDELAE